MSKSKTITLDLDQIIFTNVTSFVDSIEIEFIKPKKYYDKISFSLIEDKPNVDLNLHELYNRTIDFGKDDLDEFVKFDGLNSNRKFKLTGVTVFRNKSKTITQDVYSGIL